MLRVGVWVCLALLVVLVAGSALWLASLRLPEGAAAPGVSIAGNAPVAGAERTGGEALEALVVKLTRRVESVRVQFALDDDPTVVHAATLGELGVSVDAEATLRRARAVGRSGTPLARWRAQQSAAARGIDVPLELGFDRAALFARLAPLKRERDRAPAPARYPAAQGHLVPHVAGRYLDLERAADRVWAAALERARGTGTDASGGTLDVRIGSVPLEPRVSAAVLDGFQPRAVLGEYSTRFRTQGDQATRAANIGVAAARLDGVILMPGERMSFNDVVGERSLDNGFFDSWEILDGEFVRGVGGGTCQVSSTLNAAALRAGLRIVEAYTHSRPLAYIEKGMDATVAWPFVDLKLQNSWSVPVVIQATVTGNTIRVRLVAEDSPGRVSMRSEVKETYPFPRVVEVGGVARGSFRLKQAGIPGFRIQRTRLIWPRDGEARREVVFKRYRPTPELFLVAPDFDVNELPPLPEGAEGYEPPAGEVDPRDPSVVRIPGVLG
jgi:vancomycin resistance protein YoaR